MAKTFVIGDIHGNNKALQQCLSKSKFNKDTDTLITLGDYVDGYTEVFEVVQTLLAIPNKICIMGNHDDWFLQFMTKGVHPVHWLQGGVGTMKSYILNAGVEARDYLKIHINNTMIPESHQEFFKRLRPYYVDKQNRCFVHGGFDRYERIEDQCWQVLMWDRDFWSAAMGHENAHPENFTGEEKKPFKTVDDFKEIFIGHTSTLNWSDNDRHTEGGILVSGGKPITAPIHAANVWNMDTGAGWNTGRLTIMDVDTKEYWQSDLGSELYPGLQTR